MATGIQIRHYREGDEARLNELYQLVFGARRPLDGWYWKFRDNPVRDRILISVAEREDGRIVGMYPLLIMEFRVKDERVLAVQLVEISVHPDFRGRWIVKHLKSFLQPPTIESGIRFGFGFPTRDHAKVGVRYMGYHLLGELPILGVTISRASRIKTWILQGAIARLAYWVRFIRFYLRVSCWAAEERRLPNAVEIVGFDRFDDDFDRLWEEISGDYPVMVHRSSRYLNWRYIENPMADFKVLGQRRDGRLVGYLVYASLTEAGSRNGVIFDFICREGEPARRLLLREGVLRLLRRRVNSIRCAALPHTPPYRDLISLGFTKWASSPLVNFEALDKGLDAGLMGDLKSWYLTMGDTDLLGW